MSDQNPYGATPPPPAGQPPAYGAVPPQAGAPGSPYGAVPPQAPPPGYPAQGGYGAYAPAPAPRRSRRTLWILLGCLAGILVLIGGLLAYFVFDVTSDAGTQKVVLPSTFKDLKRDENSPIAEAMQKSLTDEFGKGDGGWNPTGVSAVYQDADDEPKLIVAGAYGKVLLPKQELDNMWKGASSDGTTIKGKHAVDAGPKGGTMECATAETAGSEFGICAWADKSSLVMVMKGDDTGKSPDLEKLAAETRELRAVAEVPQ